MLDSLSLQPLFKNDALLKCCEMKIATHTFQTTHHLLMMYQHTKVEWQSRLACDTADTSSDSIWPPSCKILDMLVSKEVTLTEQMR